MLKRHSFILVLAFIWSCSGEPDCGDPNAYRNSSIELEFQDLTHAFHEVKSEEELSTLLAQNPIIRDQFFEYGDRPTLTSLHNEIFKLVQTPRVKNLFNSRSYAAFDKALQTNREMREFLSFDYLTINKGKNLEDIYNLFKKSEIEKIDSPNAIGEYLSKNAVERNYFHSLFAYRTEEQLLSDNFKLLSNPYVDTLYQQTLSLMNAGRIAFDLDQGFKRLKEEYPDFNTPVVQAVYSGFGKDIVLSDSLIVLGLDYYLGEQATYRPNVYDYIKVRLTPKHLVPQVFQFLSLKFNETKQGRRNVLDEMIYYGKAMEFTKEMLPCVEDTLIIGYGQQDFANATVSEAIIWSYFLENRLLYEENTKAITRYVDERPSIPEISKNCPGRIGQWLGWQIVKAYREETGASLKDLMAETDTQKILTLSKYRPRYPQP